MRRIALLVLLATSGLAACGGSTTTKTVTVTKTVTAPAPAASTPQATTPPGGEDTTATTTPAPGSADASPLPDGVVAADGRYKMRTRQSDFDGENITVDDEFPTDSESYSVRLTAPENLNGRTTAKRMDVYFVETARGCSLSTSARGVVSWRGNRE